MSTNVSNEVTAATLHLFMIALTEYEPGITQYIKELCGIHTNEPLDKWFDIINQFKLHQESYSAEWRAAEAMLQLSEIFTTGRRDNAIEHNNITYYGDLIKNKVIQKHNDFLKEMYVPQNREVESFWGRICQKWIINRITVPSPAGPPTIYSNRLNFFTNFTSSPQYRDKRDEIMLDPLLITKCDVIFWTMNQHDMYDYNPIDNDANNVIELIYHVPKHLARDTPGQEGFHKISYFIQGCVVTVIARHIKKMPLYTKFNPILQQHEYNKNFMSEYIKPRYSSEGEIYPPDQLLG